MDEGFEKRPFGAPGLGEFVVSQPREAAVSDYSGPQQTKIDGIGHVVLRFTMLTCDSWGAGWQ